MKRLLPTLAVLFVLSIAAAFSLPASAIEYRTVNAVTVLYDAPSQRGSKLFVIRRYTPVEVVVALDGWSKVRDAEGSLAWIEKKFLSDKRSVIVTAERAEVRQKADEGSPLAFEAEKSSLDTWKRCRAAGSKVATLMDSRASCAAIRSGASRLEHNGYRCQGVGNSAGDHVQRAASGRF